VLGLFVVAVHLAHLPASAQSPAPANHVVIISLDGFTARALADPSVPLPNLRRLAAAGAMAKTMRPVNPTVAKKYTEKYPARPGIFKIDDKIFGGWRTVDKKWFSQNGIMVKIERGVGGPTSG